MGCVSGLIQGMVRVSIVPRKCEWGRVVRVETDDGQVHNIEAIGRDDEESLHKARVFRALYEGLGGFELEERRGAVPTGVACAGKAAIAAYLYTVQQMRPRDIAEDIGVSKRTVSQYISDVKAGRRL
ncbi:uncharacterized protein Nmag_0241 [Natrialba magadii ATCC 43099]|uniref:HTH domain protein n=1 Tax=Natrialba magadii (strain ATCC 43099 / DSM 3394 / CCM 3739 / CIP 104546 / IAM 13178 / JCM 8861 / NBRC 102185 / NCIMB 2190 / MS3) TaxID=547559 RepID=D3SX13_NATMM|nr:uncharacterized protein Nmag_0241 [Natrialba magadii ATCC 43099]ELY33495.1 hypothetical protein C500_01645 [Natrialba magadii ATCC 43099]